MFAYNLSILLTSTAFVSTNAKYGIPLLRYTVFLKNTAYLERDVPCFAFVITNAVLVRKIDKAYMNVKRLPCVKGAVSEAD